MIQGSINQLLHLTTIAARLDPGSEERRQIRASEKEVKQLEKQANLADAGRQKPPTPASVAAENELAEDIVKATKRRFQLNPTEKNYAAYANNVRAAEKFKAEGEELLKPSITPADPEDIKREQAEMKAQRALAREQKRIQKTKDKLMANAPAPMAGKRGTIKYDNI